MTEAGPALSKEEREEVQHPFDLSHLQGPDLRAAPQRRRKALLRRALRFVDPLRFTPQARDVVRERTGPG